MSCIGWPREEDPELHDMYSHKLLVPGWAGQVSEAEAKYISEQLTKRPELRRQWEVAKLTRQRKKITPSIAKRLCYWWNRKALQAIELENSESIGKE